MIETRVSEHRLQALALTPQWGTQVMGDVAGHMLEVCHQFFYPAQHVVQDLGESAEFVARTHHRHAPREVACHDGASGPVDGIHSAEQRFTNQQSATERDGDGSRQGYGERSQDQRPCLMQIPRIVRHDDEELIGQPLASSAQPLVTQLVIGCGLL